MIRKSQVRISQFYWLPMLGSIMGAITAVASYLATVLNGYFKPILPFISYTALFPPASLIFGVGISLSCTVLALSAVLWKFDRDNFIDSAFGREDSYQIQHTSNPRKTYETVKCLNKLALAFGILGIVTFNILAQANVSA